MMWLARLAIVVHCSGSLGVVGHGDEGSGDEGRMARLEEAIAELTRSHAELTRSQRELIEIIKGRKIYPIYG